jgi:hypothetical protein
LDLRFGLSSRDVEELLAERGIEVEQSPSTAGCSGSRSYSLTLIGPADTLSVTAGTWTRPR